VFNNEKTGPAEPVIEKSDWMRLEQLFTVYSKPALSGLK
jgi:hypothetical protein